MENVIVCKRVDFLFFSIATLITDILSGERNAAKHLHIHESWIIKT